MVMGTGGITITIICLIVTNYYYIKVSAENYEKFSPTLSYASGASAGREFPRDREDEDTIPSSSFLVTARSELPVVQRLIQLSDIIHYHQDQHQQKQDIGNLFKYLLRTGSEGGGNEKRSWQNLQGSWGKRNNEYSLQQQPKQPIYDDLNNNENINGVVDYDSLIEEGTSIDNGKRAWKAINGAWGKRRIGGNYNEGKREPGWNNLKGLWGKRGNWNKLSSSWGKRNSILSSDMSTQLRSQQQQQHQQQQQQQQQHQQK